MDVLTTSRGTFGRTKRARRGIRFKWGVAFADYSQVIRGLSPIIQFVVCPLLSNSWSAPYCPMTIAACKQARKLCIPLKLCKFVTRKPVPMIFFHRHKTPQVECHVRCFLCMKGML